MKTQTQTGRGRRTSLSQRLPNEQEIVSFISEVDKHLPEKARDNDHYVAAARAVVKERCRVAEVDTGLIQLVLMLRLLRSGEGLAPPMHWPEGTRDKVAEFFRQYPSATMH